MPIITPPSCDELPFEEPEESNPRVVSKAEHNRITRFLDVPNWKCPECGAINFGRNKKCAYCFGRYQGKITLRPSDYVEPPL